MRISDWSSDVCSSDLRDHRARRQRLRHVARIMDVEPDQMPQPMGEIVDPPRLAEHLLRRLDQILIIDPGLELRDSRRLGSQHQTIGRPEKSRVGKGWASTGRARWSADLSKKKQ